MSEALAQERLLLGSDRLPHVLAGGQSRSIFWQRHTVPCLEINTICHGGPIPAMLNGIEHQLTAGAVYAYRPGDVFRAPPYREDGTLVLQWVRFDWPGWRRGHGDDTLSVGRMTPLPAARFTAVRASLDQIITLYRLGAPGWRLEAGALLLQVLVQLHAQRQPTSGGPGDERLALALAHIDRHLAQPLSLAQLARAAHTSPDYLARIFRASLGKPPGQYLIERRLQEGRRRLVEEPDATIQAIGQRVGIPHASHFSRLFARRFGMTPQRFRLTTAWRQQTPEATTAARRTTSR